MAAVLGRPRKGLRSPGSAGTRGRCGNNREALGGQKSLSPPPPRARCVRWAGLWVSENHCFSLGGRKASVAAWPHPCTLALSLSGPGWAQTEWRPWLGAAPPLPWEPHLSAA